MMETQQWGPHERISGRITAVSNAVRILCDGRQMTSASSALYAVGCPSNEPQSLENALEKVATSVPKENDEDTFDGLNDRAVSEERPACRVQSPQSRSPAWRDDAVRSKFANISGVVDDSFVRLIGDLGRATDSSPDTKVLSVIRTVVNRSVRKPFRSFPN